MVANVLPEIDGRRSVYGCPRIFPPGIPDSIISIIQETETERDPLVSLKSPTEARIVEMQSIR